MLLSQTLHHAANPSHALEEAARVLRPGGRVLVLELRAHDETWVRDKLGDRHLGFTDDALTALLTTAGLVDVRVGVGSRRSGDPFTVLIASASKPGTRTHSIEPRPATTRRAQRAISTVR